MKTIAVIPCYNEEQAIGDLVFRSNQFVSMTIVADDNSTDKTVDIASLAGAVIVRNFTRGAGANTASGINSAMIQDADIVVTLDGDGQHDPQEIPSVIEPILKGEADCVIGSRFLKPVKIARYRRFGIAVITWLFNVGRKDKITDAQCCFRAYSGQFIKTVRITERGFAFSVETLVKARHNGFRITEVPVRCIYHSQFHLNSTINPVSQGLSVAWAIIKWRVRLELLGRIKCFFQ